MFSMNAVALSVVEYKYFPPSSRPLYGEITSIDEKIKGIRARVEGLKKEDSAFRSQLERELINQEKDLDQLNSRSIKYEEIKVIGEGGCSTVYKVKNTANSREYALKITKPERSEFIDNERDILSFLNEQENATGVRFVSRLEAYFLFKDQIPSLLMSFYPKNISHLIAYKKSFSERESLMFLKDILEILQFLKKNGVIHLDIKPENFLISAGERMKLGDFGYSIFKQNCPPTSSRGTRFYISPEFCMSTDFCDFASDMWSAAATICFAYLGGFEMFGAGSLIQIFKNHQIRFRKQYPEYLKQEASKKGEGRERLICPENQLNSAPTFDQVMKIAFDEKQSPDLSAFNQLKDVLKKMFELEYERRITPESALELLSSESSESRKKQKIV